MQSLLNLSPCPSKRNSYKASPNDMTVNDLPGGVRKGRKREPKKTPTQVVTSETVSFPVTEESNVVPGSNTTIASQSSPCLLSSTPKRSRKRAAQSPEPCCTSTPVHRPSNNNLPSSPSELEIITRLKVADQNTIVIQFSSISQYVF